MSIDSTAEEVAEQPPSGAAGARHQPYAFQLKLELAYGQRRGLHDLNKLITDAARLSAAEGLPPRSPLIDIAQQHYRHHEPALKWHFERSYWAHRADNDPAAYFQIELQDLAWVLIESRGIAGAKGYIRIHRHQVGDFFFAARCARVQDYGRWVTDQGADGGMVLLRMHSFFDGEGHRVPPDEEGALRIASTGHLSDGHLYFGHPYQETRQLGALCRLEDSIVAMLAATAPRPADRAAAQDRARQLLAKGAKGIPADGYCPCCDIDVTGALTCIQPGQQATICPACSATWHN